MVNASSNRLARWSNGYPNARYSGSCHPAPRPSTRRPPLISSTVTAAFARSAGFRKLVHATKVPSVIRLVAAARAARTDQLSHVPTGRSSRPARRKSRWSGSQRESKPSDSALCEKADRSRQDADSPAIVPSIKGSMSPTFGIRPRCVATGAAPPVSGRSRSAIAPLPPVPTSCMSLTREEYAAPDVTGHDVASDRSYPSPDGASAH